MFVVSPMRLRKKLVFVGAISQEESPQKPAQDDSEIEPAGTGQSLAPCEKFGVIHKLCYA